LLFAIEEYPYLGELYWEGYLEAFDERPEFKALGFFLIRFFGKISF